MGRSILILDAPQIGKKQHTINAILGYLFSYYKAMGYSVSVMLPYTDHWRKHLLSLNVEKFTTVFVSLKWWHELAGAFDLLELFKNLGVLDKVIMGGITAILFATEIQRRFPGVVIYNPYQGNLPFKFPATLSLDKKAFAKGLVSGYIPLSEGCNDKCYFCGALPIPSLGFRWRRGATSVRDDIETLCENPNIEIFFDTDAETLLLRSLKILKRKCQNNVYFFFWRTPNYQLIETLLSRFDTVRICLDVVTLDDDARDILVSHKLLKHAPDVQQVGEYILSLHEKYHIPIDLSFAVGHPLEKRDNVLRSLDYLTDIYRQIGCHGEIKFTPLHVLPHTLFETFSSSYIPKWKTLNDFLQVSKPISKGGDYYKVLMSPPDGYPLGFANHKTSRYIIGLYNEALHIVDGLQCKSTAI